MTDSFDASSAAPALRPGIVLTMVLATRVSTIDGDSIAGGSQSFTFLNGLNTAFSETPGELRFVSAAGGNTMVEGNTNSDTTADFQIELTGNIALTGADIVP